MLLRILKQGRLEIRSAFIVFEKDAEGGYTQISDFGSEPQIYLDKRVDDLTNYRRVSSFTLALIAAREPLKT